MGVSLPRYVALKSLSNNKYLRFVNENVSDHGFLQFSGEEVLSLYTQFELEMSQTKYGLYNIRCRYTNKYFVPESSVSPCLMAGANEPNEEDHWSSTLFEPMAVVADESGNHNADTGAIIVQFRHFRSKEYATASVPEQTIDAEHQESTVSLPDDEPIVAEQQESTASLTDQPIHDAKQQEPTAFSSERISGGYEVVTIPLVLSGRPQGTIPQNQKFLVIDLESFFILPKLVAFKAVATDGQYLGARTIGDQLHLQLVSDDIGDPTVLNEVLPFSDGSVLIKSKHVNKIWRSSPGGIVADYDLKDRSGQEEGEDTSEIRFVPIKLGHDQVALRNVVTGKYCINHAAEGKPNCLNDAVDDATTIFKDSIFQVHEPVVAREVYDVKFNFLDARIYGNEVIILAIQTGTNNLTEPTTMTFKPRYMVYTRSSWDNWASFTELGMKTTLKSGVPSVVSKGEIKITSQFEGSYPWGREIVTSADERERPFDIIIRPKTKLEVKVLATQVRCDVPFFYTRRDTLTNGQVVLTSLDDGMYTGISFYNIEYNFTENQL